MPGPDFPGGGQIITPPRGDPRRLRDRPRQRCKVRARWKIEDLARGQWQRRRHRAAARRVGAQKVLEEIEELTNPKVKAGKKALPPEQLQLKAD